MKETSTCKMYALRWKAKPPSYLMFNRSPMDCNERNFVDSPNHPRAWVFPSFEKANLQRQHDPHMDSLMVEEFDFVLDMAL